MKLVLATLLCFLFLSVAIAQTAKRHNVFDMPCHGLKTLPFRNEKSELKELEPLGIEGAEVHRKFHKLADEQIVFLQACDARAKKPILDDEYLGRPGSLVRDFISYETNGRVFAYRFTGYAIMTKNGFITERYGASGDIYYVDEKGDGTFERYQGAMPLRFLPDWLRN